MSKLKTVIAGLAITSTLAFVACKSNSEYEGYTKSESGMFYKFFKQDEKGAKPKEGEIISIYYKFILTKNDSTILDSKNVSRDGTGIIQMPLYKPTFKGCIEDGLAMMSKGDSASFIISADSFYFKTQKVKELPPFVKAGDRLTINIKLHDIKSQQQAQQEQAAEMQKMAGEEKGKIEAYLAKNAITVAPTASGIYIVEKVKGKGKKIQAGDIAQVHYKGMFVDGNVFDSSEGRPEPLAFPVGKQQVIPGWDEAILSMTVGTKATLVIPSNMAYGPGGSGPIPPYSPLVFEIEVVGIKDPASVPPAPASK